MEGEWSCYGGCQFNGGRMVITEVPSNRGSMFMLQWWAISGRENGHATRVVTLMGQEKWPEEECYRGG